jgi:hypothetical protein
MAGGPGGVVFFLRAASGRHDIAAGGGIYLVCIRKWWIAAQVKAAVMPQPQA